MEDPTNDSFEVRQVVTDEALITQVLRERSNLMMERARSGFASGFSDPGTLVCLEGKSYRVGLDGDRVVIEEITQFIG
jgi:hypothetical protein